MIVLSGMNPSGRDIHGNQTFNTTDPVTLDDLQVIKELWVRDVADKTGVHLCTGDVVVWNVIPLEFVI